MRKTSLSLLLLATLGLTACGGSSSSQTTITDNSESSSVTIGGSNTVYVPEVMNIQLDLVNQLPATFPDGQLLEVAVNFDLDNSGNVSTGDIQARLKRAGTGWTSATSNLYYIFVQDGGNVVFDEATSFQSEGGQITKLGVASVGTIEQSDSAGKTTLTLGMITNPQRSVQGDFNGSDAVYTAFEQALSNITSSTPVNAAVGLADENTTPATTVSFDQAPDGGVYFQGSNASITDNASDYSGASGEADIEKVSILFSE